MVASRIKVPRCRRFLNRKVRSKLALHFGQSTRVANFLISENEGFGWSTLHNSMCLDNDGTSNSKLQAGHRYMTALYADAPDLASPSVDIMMSLC
jgi:hypothetical protein